MTYEEQTTVAEVVIVNFNLNSTVEYVARRREDCKDEIDRMAYDLACEHGEVKMGQVWAYIERDYS